MMDSLPIDKDEEVAKIFTTNCNIRHGKKFASLLWAMLNCIRPKDTTKLFEEYKEYLPMYRTTLSLFFIGGTLIELNQKIQTAFGKSGKLVEIPAYTFWDF